MGIHTENISDLKFNSSFRNLIRDYYVYGFKDKKDFKVLDSTYNENRRRLIELLPDYIEWTNQVVKKNKDSQGKNITFMTCDSQSMKTNPFHRVYRFCGTDRPEYLNYFFHTMAVLSGVFKLPEGLESLGYYNEAAKKLEKKLYIEEERLTECIRSMHLAEDIELDLESYFSDREKLIEKAVLSGLSDDNVDLIKEVIENTRIELKTSELIKFYNQNDNRSKYRNTIRKTANNRLMRLNNVGVVSCNQTGGEKYFSMDQIEHVMNAIPDSVETLLEQNNLTGTLEKALKNYSLQKSGDHNWYLNNLTLQKIIDAGQSVNEDFYNHFRYALDFYSKTFLFGETGTFLLDRMGEYENGLIRIKHEYFMHALNDFNIIDLMEAMENNLWCLISYKREEMETLLLCFPLELRVSSENGREYLMYYEPFKRSCAALRVEFVEKIQYYPDSHVKKNLEEYYSDSKEVHNVDQNIGRSKLLLRHTWGISTGAVHERNVENMDSLFREVCIRIKYDKNRNPYVLNRLYRESRIGTIFLNEEEGYIDFVVNAADITELIPFIRSFYSDIVYCEGFEKEKFSVEVDIQKHSVFTDIISSNESTSESINKSELASESDNVSEADLKDDSRNNIWRSEEKFVEILGNGINANAHDFLFNEIFSVHYYIFAAFLEEVGCRTEGFTDKELDKLCSDVMKRFRHLCSPKMISESFKNGIVFAEMLNEGGFLIEKVRGTTKKYFPRYENPFAVDLYKQVIPLTKIEIRWLKTILADEKIHYFFTDKEIIALEQLLTEKARDQRPHSMEFINYYDRYKFSVKKEWKESKVLLSVLNAVEKNHIVKIDYISKKKNRVSGNYKPLLIEYSKRNNCFQGYFLSCRRKEGIEYPGIYDKNGLKIPDTVQSNDVARHRWYSCNREEDSRSSLNRTQTLPLITDKNQYLYLYTSDQYSVSKDITQNQKTSRSNADSINRSMPADTVLTGKVIDYHVNNKNFEVALIIKVEGRKKTIRIYSNDLKKRGAGDKLKKNYPKETMIRLQYIGKNEQNFDAYKEV